MNPANLLIIAALFPLLSFLLLLCGGRSIGRPLSGWIATVLSALSFACSILAVIGWLSVSGARSDELYQLAGATPGASDVIRRPMLWLFNWLPLAQSSSAASNASPAFLQLGIYIDSLTVVLFATITLVALCVHVFSLKYMENDAHYPRFFAYLGLFCFSMLGLVIGATLLHIFVFWELVGLCSYLLIGFWSDRPAASRAALKAFVVNRVGDLGFLIGLGLLVWHVGNLSLPDVWGTLDASRISQHESGQWGITLGDGATISRGMLTFIGISLFAGAAGKSAQFPLHVWLPDAMEGPTPISALIHAATMVAAGVYLVARIFPILTPDARLFIAVIGCVTLTFAALVATVQRDIKQVLAWSTISQLGYMMLALGVGSWVGGLFHLVTHAFFKALLFLAAGSVIHATGHVQDLRSMGGLWRKMPITAITFLVAIAAIAGVPMFSGYFSKTMILIDAGAFASYAKQAGRSGGYLLLFALPVFIAYLTPFYMMRCWMLAFAHRPRDADLHRRAGEAPLLYGPLLALAVMSAAAGSWFGAEQMLVNATQEDTIFTRQRAATYEQFAAFDSIWPAEPPSAATDLAAASSAQREARRAGEALDSMWVTWAFAVGLGGAILLYVRGLAASQRLLRWRPAGMIHRWLLNRMYIDELYNLIVVNMTILVASVFCWIDRHIVDAIVGAAAASVRVASRAAGVADDKVVDGAVSGFADLAQDIGAAVRMPQTGRIRVYMTLLLSVLTAGVAIAAGIIFLAR